MSDIQNFTQLLAQNLAKYLALVVRVLNFHLNQSQLPFGIYKVHYQQGTDPLFHNGSAAMFISRKKLSNRVIEPRWKFCLCVSPFLAWGNFHARSHFARSTIPEEKWGLLVVYSAILLGTSWETQGKSVGSGARAERKFSSTSKRAPGYRLSPSNFQKFKRMPAPEWAQKMLCIIVPNIGEQFLLSSFREFIHDAYCLDHGLSGSCTKDMHAVRKLSV